MKAVLLLGLLLSGVGVSRAQTPHLVGWFESSTPATLRSNDTITVSGWAYDDANANDPYEVKEVRIYLGSTHVATISPGGGLYQNRSGEGLGYAGWSKQFSIGIVSTGTHYLTAKAFDSTGEDFPLSVTAASPITVVNNSAPVGALDSRTNPVSPGGTMTLVGWAADYDTGAPVSDLKVHIDGLHRSDVSWNHVSSPRSDVVNSNHPANFLNSGWTISFGIGSLAAGSHTISVYAIDDKNAEGLLGTQSFTVLPGQPLIATHPVDATINESGNTTFTVSASVSSGSLSYQWYRGGQSLTGQPRWSGTTSSTLTGTGLLASDAGDIYVIVTNTAGGYTATSQSTAAKLRFYQSVLAGQDAHVIFGSSWTPSTVAGFNGSSTAPLKFSVVNETNYISGSWTPTTAGKKYFYLKKEADSTYVEKISYNSATASTPIPGSNPALTGYYTLYVDQIPTISTVASQTVTAGSSTSVTFSATVTVGVPSSTMTYQWFKGSSVVPGGTNTTLTISPVSSADAGTYGLTAINGAAQATSNVATLTVNPALQITTQPSHSGTVGFNDPISITVGAIGGGLRYQWFVMMSGLPSALSGQTSATLYIPHAQPTPGTTYKVQVTDSIGAYEWSQPVTVQVALGSVSGGIYWIQDTDYLSGDNITEDQPIPIHTAGTVTVQSEAVLTLKTPTTGRVRLSPGFRAMNGSWFRASLNGSVGEPVYATIATVAPLTLAGPSGPFGFQNGDGWTEAAKNHLGTKPTTGGRTQGGALPADWPALSTAIDTIGATKGAFSVSAGGAATYSVPLAVTPGTAGMAPQLALDYSSQGGDGPLGMRWQLRGLHTITRGPATNPVDGKTRGMDFSAEDKFYLDGSRLIAVSDAPYGGAGTEYRTEIDTYAKIVSYGSSGTGPLSFKVWTKSGEIWELGGTTDSRLKRPGFNEIFSWHLSSISDRSDNAIKYTYATFGTNELLPTEINYTCNTAAPNGYASVIFDYETKVDSSSGYVYDMELARTRKLVAIRNNYGTDLFRKYKLVYEDAANLSGTRLSSLQEIAQDGSAYPATSFTYSARGVSIDPLPAAENLLSAAYTERVPVNYGVYPGDFDGDGLTDLIRLTVGGVNGTRKVEFYRNKGGALELTGTLDKVLSDKSPTAATVMDMNGDGKAEVVLMGFGAANYATIIRWSGAALTLTETMVTGDNVGASVATNSYPMDINQDGREDLVVWEHGHTSSTWGYTVFESQPDGVSFKGIVKRVGFPYNHSNFFPVGVGDGGQPMFARVVNQTIDLLRWNPEGPSFDSISNTTLTSPTEKQQFVAMDVNGDGKPDIVKVYKAPNAQNVQTRYAQVLLQTGLGFVTKPALPLGTWTEYNIFPVDYNGDGKADLAMLNFRNTDTTFDIWCSTGSSFNRAVEGQNLSVESWAGGEFPKYINAGKSTIYNCVVAQGARVGRDGLSGLLFVGSVIDVLATNTVEEYDQGGFPIYQKINAYHDFSYRLVSFKGQNPDLITSIKEPIGAEITVSHLPLTAETIYEKGTGAVYPLADVTVPMVVVSRVLRSDARVKDPAWTNVDVVPPNRDPFKTMYTYHGLRSDANRGLVGFESITETKELDDIPQRTDKVTSALLTKTEFVQKFPYTGMVSKVTVSHSTSGAMVSQTTNELPSTERVWSQTAYSGESSPRKVYRPSSAGSVTRKYDLTGTAISTVTSVPVYDDYGNVTSLVERTFSGAPETLADASAFKTTTTSTYHPVDETNWLVGRVNKVTVRAASPTLPNPDESLDRIVTHLYNADRPWLLETKKTQPGTTFELKEEFTYDTYGNVETQTVSGADVPESKVTHYYDAIPGLQPYAGRLRNKMTNALSEATTYEYDARLGVVTKTTDANNFSTTLQYNSFGVLKAELRPDQTTKRTLYRPASVTSASAQVKYPDGTMSEGAYSVETQVIATSSASATTPTFVAPPTLTIFNAHGQAIRTLAINADGNVTYDDVGYDTAGNVIYDARPRLVTALKSYWTATTYDALSRPIVIIAPYLDTEEGKAGNTGLLYANTYFRYDGLVTNEDNGRGVTTRTTRNGPGWVTEVFSNPPADPATPLAVDQSYVTFAHDPFGNVTDTTDSAGHVIHLTYDLLGRKVAMTDPDMGAWSYGYYADGKLKYQTDANLKATTFVYDALGRAFTKQEGRQAVAPTPAVPMPTLDAADLRTTQWTYTVAATKRAGHHIGQKEKVVITEAGPTAFPYTETWDYDQYARPSSNTRTFAGKTFVTTQDYDDYGRPRLATYPGSDFRTINAYNGLGHLKEVRLYDPAATDSLGQILWYALEADGEGRTSAAILGNGSTVDWVHSAASGRFARVVSKLAQNLSGSSGVLAGDWTLTARFDTVGNLDRRSLVYPTPAQGNYANYERFDYDGLNRLNSVGYSDHKPVSETDYSPTKGYEYDSLGNITKKTDLTVNSGKYTYHSNHPHAVETANGGTYGYDTVGNLTAGANGLTASWTHFNQPLEIKRGARYSRFRYGAEEERVVQMTDRGTTYYAGTTYERFEPTSGAAEERYYVMTPTGRSVVAKITDGQAAQPTLTYLHADHLGSVEIVSDAAALVVSQYAYDAWGAARTPTDWQNLATPPSREETKRGFTDHEMLDDLGLVHMNGRVYDPLIGRFLRADPTIQAPFNPQSYNRYTYVFNNPLSLTDPTGYAAEGDISPGAVPSGGVTPGSYTTNLGPGSDVASFTNKMAAPVQDIISQKPSNPFPFQALWDMTKKSIDPANGQLLFDFRYLWRRIQREPGELVLDAGFTAFFHWGSGGSFRLPSFRTGSRPKAPNMPSVVVLERQGDPIELPMARDIGTEMANNPVGAATLRQLRARSLKVHFDFVNAPRSDSGAAVAGEANRFRATVYVWNNLSARGAAATGTHEGRHTVMGNRGINQRTQWAEFMARARETLFLNNGVRPTAAQRELIWREIRSHSEYTTLPFR